MLYLCYHSVDAVFDKFNFKMNAAINKITPIKKKKNTIEKHNSSAMHENKM